MSVCYRCGKHGDPMLCTCMGTIERLLTEASDHFKLGRPELGKRELAKARTLLGELRADVRGSTQDPWKPKRSQSKRAESSGKMAA